MAQSELVDGLLPHEVNAPLHACATPMPPRVCDRRSSGGSEAKRAPEGSGSDTLASTEGVVRWLQPASALLLVADRHVSLTCALHMEGDMIRREAADETSERGRSHLSS